jgi:hypothetical protein
MQEFIDHHKDCIHGVLRGFDRLIFRGTLRAVSYPAGLLKWLNMHDIRLTQFDAFAQRCTRRVVEHIEALARKSGRPCRYLSSAAASKERVAMQIAEQDGITAGLVCVLSCVEPCVSVDIYRNRETKRLEPVFRHRKCKFYYLYFIDPLFGWMHVRIQSWVPFDVQVYINGRSYLQRQLDRCGIGYEKRDNCFVRIDDLPAAQRSVDRLEKLNRPGVLKRLVGPCLPRGGGAAAVLPPGVGYYYWTIRQSEYATDVIFKDAGELAALYPRLCRHAIESLAGEDVLKFMGKSPSRHRGEVVSSSLKLAEGVRVKHRVGGNSIKMYDKQQTLLRIETTVNDPSSLRVYRGPLNDPTKKPTWRAMGKSVADIARRAAVCRDANARYLSALAAVPRQQPSFMILDPLARPVVYRGRRCRGLRPICPDDAALFAAVMRGEHLIDGLSNRTLQAALFTGPPRDQIERRRRSAQVSRKLRLLRRQGLIHKLGRRRLYRITSKGHRVMSLAGILRESNANLLNAA